MQSTLRLRPRTRQSGMNVWQNYIRRANEFGLLAAVLRRRHTATTNHMGLCMRVCAAVGYCIFGFTDRRIAYYRTTAQNNVHKLTNKVEAIERKGERERETARENKQRFQSFRFEFSCLLELALSQSTSHDSMSAINLLPRETFHNFSRSHTTFNSRLRLIHFVLLSHTQLRVENAIVVRLNEHFVLLFLSVREKMGKKQLKLIPDDCCVCK